MTVAVRATAIFSTLLFLGCAGTIVAIRDDQGRPLSWQFPSQIAGKSFLAVVPATDLPASPDWDPERSTDPNLLASEAVRIAWVESRVYLAEPTGWELRSVTLHRLEGRKWLYVVAWEPTGAESGDRLQIPVLLSGHAVPLEEVNVTAGQQ